MRFEFLPEDRVVEAVERARSDLSDLPEATRDNALRLLRAALQPLGPAHTAWIEPIRLRAMRYARTGR